MTNTLFLNSALSYLRKYGMSVIPVQPYNKKPAIESWIEFQQRRATEEEITEWWTRLPDAMIGIVQGVISGTCVIDLDSYKTIYDETRVKYFLPDSVICPTSVTARGGQQLWFKCTDPDLRCITDWLPACDFKANGGYVIAPPSKGIVGSYDWMPSLGPGDMPFPALPDNLFEFLKNGKINPNLNLNPSLSLNPNTSLSLNTNTKINTNLNTNNAKSFFVEGRRDDDLYHVARKLLMSRTPINEVQAVLETLARSCSPPFPLSEIPAKIQSALKAVSRSERNLKQEVLDILSVTKRYINVTYLSRELQLVTKEDRANLRQILHRLCKDGTLEHGSRAGEYRIIDNELEEIKIDSSTIEEDEKDYNLWLPLDLHKYVEVAEGNMILIAGEHNSGKTALMLNTLKENKGKMRIRYITSEMSRQEFRKRFRGFTNVVPDFWNTDELTDYIYRSNAYQDAVLSDGLTFIDYLELDDYSQTESILRDIHDRIKEGVCIIAVQKKKGQSLGRGGDMLMGKPRLALSLYNPKKDYFVAEITKAKICIGGSHDYKQRKFQIDFGSRIIPLSEWVWEDFLRGD